MIPGINSPSPGVFQQHVNRIIEMGVSVACRALHELYSCLCAQKGRETKLGQREVVSMVTATEPEAHVCGQLQDFQ